MKRFSVFIVLLGFFFFGIGNAQIDTQTIAGWNITEMNGNVQTATSTIIDTISQSFHIELQNYDYSAYVIWGKKLDRTYSIPAYDTSRPHDIYATILWSTQFEDAGPGMTALFYQFSVGSVYYMHPLGPSGMDARSGLDWYDAGSQTNYYPNPPEEMDSVALKIFTNGTHAKGGFRGIKIQYGHNSESGTHFIDSVVTVNIFGDKATAIDVPRGTIPQTFQLSQNYPNPFNPTTSIRYMVSSITNVKLTVYDILGREIQTLVNEEKPAGTYEAIFNASNLSSGVYFYRLEADGFVQTKKMNLLK